MEATRALEALTKLARDEAEMSLASFEDANFLADNCECGRCVN